MHRQPNLNFKFYGWFRIWFLVFILFTFFHSFSQKDSINKITEKKTIVGTSLGFIYVGSMAGLYNIWYADYPRSGFHFFNDNKEWLKMDKAGHVFSAYVVGKYGIDMLKWAKFSDKQAAIAGPLYGYLYQSTIEIFDGFSSEWGFSTGDIIANTLGTGMVMSQQLAWNEQRITLKYSFSQTEFAPARPELLGNNLAQNLFKDYNGQTYWLCFNPDLFLNKSQWPSWLDISLGYGATGMYGGENNIWATGNYSSIPRRMQFYLAPDINLEKLKIKKKWLKYSFKILNTFKIPLPAIELTEGKGLKFKVLKF